MNYFLLACLLAMPFIAKAENYTIPSGDHYSIPKKVRLFSGTKLEFKAAFDSTAQYDLHGPDRLDTNKLYGTSDCSDRHQENSARFGWRWNGGRLEIMAFTHVAGQFYYQLIGPADLNKVYSYKIELSSDLSQYVFTFNGSTISMARGCRDEVMKGYKLYPYFGGNQTAPHSMLIKIDDQNQNANFLLELLYPNPNPGNYVNFNLRVEEDLDIGFNIFNMVGQLVQKVETINYSGNQNYRGLTLQLNSNLASGVYLIQPFALIDNEETPGFVAGKGNALKLIIIK